MGDKFDISKWAGRHVLVESAVTAEKLQINEASATGALAPAPRGSTRREITIIEKGWGSSGYYSREMLARDGPKVFPKGTHMYMNHPSLTEDLEQPERTVEKLAAVLIEDPVMVGDELKAKAEIFEHWSPLIDSVADNIGVSIRAIGESEWGEAEGKEGALIHSLLEGISVDFVTKAGAGGKVGMLMESASEIGTELDEARNMADWLGARIHSRFTMVADDMFGEGYVTRDERIGLSKAIGEGLDAFNAFVDSNLPQLKKRDPFSEPEEQGVVTEEAASAAERSKEEPTMGDEAKQLTEAEDNLRQLNERFTALETKFGETEQRAERAEDALIQERARNIVNDVVSERKVEEGADALPELPERAEKRIKESVLRSVPTDDDGKIDEDSLVEKTHKAIREEAEYLNGASGNGKVDGMGAVESGNNGGGNGSEKLSEADEKELIEFYRNRGLSEEAAKSAAKGR